MATASRTRPTTRTRSTTLEDVEETFLEGCNSAGLIIITVATVIVVATFFMSCLARPLQPTQVITIDSNSTLKEKVDKNFFSIGLDAIVIAEGFKNFNMTDERLIKRVRYISPGYLRVGGNLADKLHFDAEGEVNEDAQNFYSTKNWIDTSALITAPNFTMTGAQWLKLSQFAQNVGVEMIFGLNALIRFDNGSWDYRNAESLIKFSQDHNIFLNWELGNEPNSFRHKFGESVNASQLAKDFKTLKTILNKYPLYKKSLLLGPDVTRPRDENKESQVYLKEFLENSGAETVDKITWHQYYLNGHIATAADFLNTTTFGLLQTQIEKVKEIINATVGVNKTIWLGETASAFGSGAPNLSDTFIGTFLWADKLGVAGKFGVKVVMRQSIFRGHYALLDDSYEPNPDWWISILYSNLVGRRLVPYYTSDDLKLRFYVHCTKITFYDQFPNSITIFGMNLDNSVGRVRIEGLVPLGIKKNTLLYAFELTSNGKLTSKGIRLNGQLLELLPDNTLPSITPKIVNIEPFIAVPPYSVVFWLIPNTKVNACS